MTEKEKPMLIVVAGPTASGKSAAAVELARIIGGEIISADSMQVYRYMDIGSAKITQEEMMGVPHYLIDVADPTEEFDVVRYAHEAKAAISDIISRRKIPILCGGTGFYIQALLYGIDFTEMNADTDYRSSLEEEAQALGSQALYSRLQEIDPEAAEAIHPNNVKRIIRALEFAQKSGGQLISEHNRREHMRTPAYNAVFFVFNMDREKLYERIDARVDHMMQAGLVEEVSRLRAQGLTAQDVSMQGIGYRQILKALDGEYPMEEAVRLIKRDSRHFAKRQLTWFRREAGVTWINLDEYPDQEELLNFMEETIRTKLQL
jgi:tRNA dimethylallyltransferase